MQTVLTTPIWSGLITALSHIWKALETPSISFSCFDYCSKYWAGQLKEGKGCRQTLDCYCVSCELLSASIADALWFVNMVCLPLIAERNAHEICLTQECLVRRLLWKQTTTHSLHNNNPIFDGNLCPLLIDQPSTSLNILSYTIVPVERILLRTQNYRNCMRVRGAQCPYWWQ